MSGVESTDAFYELLSERLPAYLADDPPAPLRKWMLISDSRGVTACRLDGLTEDMAVDSVLAKHLANGAEAAAFITIRDEVLWAQVLLGEPRNSEIRQTTLVKKEGALALGPWASLL